MPDLFEFMLNSMGEVSKLYRLFSISPGLSIYKISKRTYYILQNLLKSTFAGVIKEVSKKGTSKIYVVSRKIF